MIEIKISEELINSILTSIGWGLIIGFVISVILIGWLIISEKIMVKKNKREE